MVFIINFIIIAILLYVIFQLYELISDKKEVLRYESYMDNFIFEYKFLEPYLSLNDDDENVNAVQNELRASPSYQEYLSYQNEMCVLIYPDELAFGNLPSASRISMLLKGEFIIASIDEFDRNNIEYDKDLFKDFLHYMKELRLLMMDKEEYYVVDNF